MRSTHIGNEVVILYPKNNVEQKLLDAVLDLYPVTCLYDDAERMYVFLYRDWQSIPISERRFL